MISTFASAGSHRAERRRASRQAHHYVHPLLVADGTHHLLNDGPANALERTEAFRRADLAIEAFGFRRPGMDTLLSPHRPGLWIPIESKGEQVQRVAEWAAREPALGSTLRRHGGGLDHGETLTFRNGCVASREEADYWTLHAATHGQPDPRHPPARLRVHERFMGQMLPALEVPRR